jgi:hypothetical protein
MTFDYGALALIGVQSLALVYFAGRFTQKVESIDERLGKVEDEHSECRLTVAKIATREGIEL